MNAKTHPKSAVPEAAPAPAPAQAFYQAESFYRGKGYKPEDSVAYLMRRTMSHFAQEVERRFEPDGLTHAQWMPLLKLYVGSGGTVAELARTCELDAGAMTRLLDRLEAKNLLRRARSSDDRRVVNIELTDEGCQAARAIPSVLCEVQNGYLSGFSREEWEMLKGFLRRILDNAQTISAAGETRDK